MKNMNISTSEWKVLFRQLVNSGKDKWEAGEIIDSHKLQFKQLKLKLEKKYKKPKDIETKFKEEFYKLCQKLES